MLYSKPANLIGSIVYNPLQAAGADVTIATGKIIFNGLPNGIKLEDVVSYKRTVFSAGVKQVTNIDLAAITIANSTQYTLILQREDTGDFITYNVFTPSAGTTAASIAAQFIARINSDTSRFINASGATTHVILTEISTDTKGFIVTGFPFAATVTITTPHTEPSGTYLEAFAYDPIKANPAGQYTKYDFTYKKDVNAAANSGRQDAVVQAIIFADQTDANYGAFDTKVTTIVTASNLADANATPYVAIN